MLRTHLYVVHYIASMTITERSRSCELVHHDDADYDVRCKLRKIIQTMGILLRNHLLFIILAIRIDA